MTKLSDTQLVLLSAASRCADGVIPITERLKGAVAKAVGEKLIAMSLAEERIILPPLMGWRENTEGQRLVLMITSRGLTAIGVEDGNDAVGQTDRSAGPATMTAPARVPASTHDHNLPVSGSGRSGTKKAFVIGLLQQDDGASIDEIMALTNWLPHTTRAFLTGLRKAGMEIAMVRQAGSVARYKTTALYHGARA